MREQTKRIVPAVERMITAYTAGTLTREEFADALVATFDYLIGEIEDMALAMDDAGLPLPKSVELYLVKEEGE